MGDVHARTAAHRFPRAVVAVSASLILACGTGRVSQVSPAEIPVLQEQLAKIPTTVRCCCATRPPYSLRNGATALQ